MQPTVEAKRLSPLALLRALNRRKLYVLLPVLVLTPAIAYYALRLPQHFRARALVGTETTISGGLAFTKPDPVVILNAQDQLRAIRETLLSTRMLERVIREFQLYDLPSDHARQTVIEAMKSRIEIQVESPEAFYVGFEGSSPEQAMLVANRLAGLFLERKSDLQGRRVEQETSFLDAEVGRLRTQVEQQEDKVKYYKQSVAGELPERLTANLKQIETLQQGIQSKTDQITEAEARRATLTEEVSALEKQGLLEAEPPAKTSAEVTLEQLRLKLSELKTKYTAEHPEIKRTEKEIRDLEARTPAPVIRRQPSAAQIRYVGLQAELKSLDPRIQSYRGEREVLISEMQTYDRRINASPAFESTLADRMRDAALTRTRYEALLAKQQEAKLSQRAEKTDGDFAYRIIEPAQAPTAPSSPHRDRIILAGFLGSLGIGLLAAFLAERANPSFETAEELERVTALPVLSSIPAIPDGHRSLGIRGSASQSSNGLSSGGWEQFTAEQRRHFQQQRLASLSDPQSVGGQQYSILALKVQQWMSQGSGKTLMVTSATGDEGKSLTALNLSLALASSLEGKVLLIDGDLRRPRVDERLGLKTEQGFSDVLAADGPDPGACISKIGALHVLPGGSNRANPVGLLASARARDILTRLRSEYQVVVIDSPPIVPVADSHILAGLCDGVVLVVRARRTSPELWLRAVESLGATNVIGVVLNDVDLAATPYAYAFRYYQRHYLGRS
jgi:polysaccharide chain length determinant protein (PEP-CTERM system associated)